MPKRLSVTDPCDAYAYYSPARINAVCGNAYGHLGDHHDPRIGHTWASTWWTRHTMSPDGRYGICVYERGGLVYDARSNPAHYDADEGKIAIYGAERLKFARKFGVPATFFAEATRLYISGGPGLDSLIASPMPYDFGDDVAWAKYNAAELEAMAKVIADVAALLIPRGTPIPASVNDYMHSAYAGCLMCDCRPAMVCRQVVRPQGGGAPLDISIIVRTDAEIAQARATVMAAMERMYPDAPANIGK